MLIGVLFFKFDINDDWFVVMGDFYFYYVVGCLVIDLGDKFVVGLDGFVFDGNNDVIGL